MISAAENQVYYKQLDFIRFVAVFLVIVEHWFATDYSRFFEFGYLGVLIFFVLSGFLITNILLRNKEQLQMGQSSIGRMLKVFYMRRTLRIFPVYYALLIFLFVFSFENIREKGFWYFLYGSNIYTYIQQKWDGLIGPLWSLAVEEQFYLIWPVLILGTKKENLRTVLLLCIFLAPIFRFISIALSSNMFSNFNESVSMRALMPNCIDSFAIGGLLALNKKSLHRSNNVCKIFEFRWRSLGVFLFVSILFLFIKHTLAFKLLFPLTFSCFAVSLINLFLTPVNGVSGNVINFPAFLFLGKISYGLYLFHGPFPLIFSIIDFALHKLGTGISIYSAVSHFDDFPRKMIWVAYLIIFSSISYFMLERPFNNLKAKFQY